MTRTAPLLEAENKKYRNEPNFPSNPMKGNPLAVQPSNPRAIGGFASPQLSKVPPSEPKTKCTERTQFPSEPHEIKAGLRAITAPLVLREKFIRPLLAASQRPNPQAQAIHPTPVDRHYGHLRVGMRDFFPALGIAAVPRLKRPGCRAKDAILPATIGRIIY